MSNKFWSCKHLFPENWIELILGVVMIGMTLMMLLITIDVFIQNRS